MPFNIQTEADFDPMFGSSMLPGDNDADRPDHEPAIRSIEDLKPMTSFGDSEISWVVDGFLAEGTITLLTSEPGEGKTTIAAEIGYRISRGEPFAGRATSLRPVLILDRENPRQGLLATFERLRIEEHAGFRVWGGWQAEDAPAPDSGIVATWALLQNPKPLIIMDSLVAFFDGGDENDAGAARAFLHRQRKLASLGVTFLDIHHIGKSETAKFYRGSSDLKAAIDLGIKIENHSDTPGRLDRLECKAFKDRLGVFQEATFQFAEGGFQDHMHGRGLSTTDRLTDLLKANPGVNKSTFREMAKNQGLRRNRAETFLDSFSRHGSIQTTTGPKGSTLYTWGQRNTNDLL